VVRTRVGYAGGTTPHPTYHDMGDYSETVQIDYDPAKITYAELLEVFWSGHDPTRRSWSRQYASIIFVHADEQRRFAEETKIRLARKLGGTVHIEIVPFRSFTLAENYHQKHSIQQFPEFEKELRQIYPAPADFIASTAVARVNGYLGGEGAYTSLVLDLERLGLSPSRREALRELVRRHKGGATCPIPGRSGQ
jgi:methionine-S-sulfoxide reductase